VALRRRLGADRLADLGLVRETSGTVVFAHLGGEVSARVVEREGPLLPMSCGAEPKPTVRFDVSF
jgi:hypothetical protein